ncbi:MAG: ABC transporter ATP-binding protein [Parachlamydiaceae bacterium]|nr:ABC transporter ATP-binding protein [Parachlamydiaceae bacterium]
MKMIEIKNLGKKYSIFHEHQNPYASLKEILTDKAKGFLNHLVGKGSVKEDNIEEFWALNDVSLSIEEGDKVALLGRNGAGKSTLLKLLARITEPTTGQIIIRGKVSSLLEVGTGFHPELTGRENIFLNGAIIGISYKEMKRKFDEIVAFADVEKFLDTPIKRYSSGMFMRLGFAIAAHLDSDVLIVDEVLAVGDAQFQEKCLKKMNEMGAQGRTVLFVSHSINSVLALCNKGIYLEKGELKAFEPIEKCISRYVQSCPIAGLVWEGNVGDDSIRFFKASLQAPSNDVGFFYHGEKTLLQIDFEVLKPNQDLILGFSIMNARHQTIARTRLCDHEQHHELVTQSGCHNVCFEMDLELFHPGEYQIKLECSHHNRNRILEDDVLLKFAVYGQNKIVKHETGMEKDGISLGNRWLVPHR